MDTMISALEAALRNASDDTLSSVIVDAPFQHKLESVMMGLGIIVLLVCSEEDGQIHRVALSNTEMAQGTKQGSAKRFEDIKIPLDHTENLIAKAVQTGESQMTTDWQYLFVPALNARQARYNQTGGGIACSYVYPLESVGCKGALIFSYFQHPSYSINDPRPFMDAYTKLVSAVMSPVLAASLLRSAK